MDVIKLIVDVIVHIMFFTLFFIVATIIGFIMLGMITKDIMLYLLYKLFLNLNLKSHKGLSWIEKNCLKIFKT